MKQQPTYPANVQRRQFWRTARRMFALLGWQARMLDMFGLLERPGRLSRWISQRCGVVEHFLRCLLVLALSARPARQGPPAPEPVSRTREAHRPAAGDIHDDQAPGPSPRLRRVQMGLSLAALGHAGPPPCIPTGAPTGDPSPARKALTAPSPSPPMSRSDRLASRLAAMADILADPDRHMGRLARRLRTLGLTLRRPACTRPCGALPMPRVTPASLLMAPHRAPAICDTS